ncbi:MAG: rhodanese-like domain-containing protein [Deltaproteobacteria bacterium]|nr:rhodanese-like domain-containing protein [Deltaproteobacteria bacterium]
MKRALGILLRSVILAGVACAVGLGVNLLRPEGLPWVAAKPYDIYKPCPMMTLEAKPVAAGQLCSDLTELLVIDARSREDYVTGHLPGARSLPYHPIKSPPAGAIAELKAAGPNKLLVYGDTAIDSGRLLAAELSEAGCLGVRYVSGGVKALVEAGRQLELGEEPAP